MDEDVIKFIKFFNDSPNTFSAECRNFWKSVAEDRESFVNRYQGELGQPIYFSQHPSGTFFAIQTPVSGFNSNTYWLFPKPDASPNEYTSAIWEICFGYSKDKKYSKIELAYPAKLVCGENRIRFEMVASGKINFN